MVKSSKIYEISIRYLGKENLTYQFYFTKKTLKLEDILFKVKY